MKSKRCIMMIIAIILFASMSLIGLSACDDDNNGSGPMIFKDGTTVNDIVAMFESGEINSCSVKVQMFLYDDNGTDYRGHEYLLKFAPNIFENNLWSIVYSDGELYKDMGWDIYEIIEGNFAYVITYWQNSGEDEEIHVYKQLYDENGDESLKQQWEQIKQAVKDASSVSIETDRIIIKNPNLGSEGTEGTEGWHHAPYIEIYDINNTTVEIREACKNYREIAVEDYE